jgi:polyphosphate kinase 2 (PPK2 family)
MPNSPTRSTTILVQAVRAGTWRVMGFATPDQVKESLKDVPEFQRTIVRSAVRSLTYRFFPVSSKDIRLPNRVSNPDYERRVLPKSLYVPEHC